MRSSYFWIYFWSQCILWTLGLEQVFSVHVHGKPEIQGYVKKEKNKKGKRRQLVPNDSPTFSRCPTKFCNLELCEALLCHTKQSSLHLNQFVWISIVWMDCSTGEHISPMEGSPIQQAGLHSDVPGYMFHGSCPLILCSLSRVAPPTPPIFPQLILQARTNISWKQARVSK